MDRFLAGVDQQHTNQHTDQAGSYAKLVRP